MRTGDRIAVYSVRLGDYDTLVEQPVAAESAADFIYLTDDSTLTSQTWKVRLIEEDFHRLMFDTEGV